MNSTQPYYFIRSHLKNTTSRVSLSLSKAIGLKKHGFDKLNLTFNLFLRWLLATFGKLAASAGNLLCTRFTYRMKREEIL
jgi:hypothetical protein